MRSKRIAQVSRPPPRGRTAFTLIELLVVISIIALLMAILLPTLARVRKQARGVVCRANLRQWGALWAAYAAENDGRIAGPCAHPNDVDLRWYWYSSLGPKDATLPWVNATRGIFCCPMAVKPTDPTGHNSPVGGTFSAWGWGPQSQERGWRLYASYGQNASFLWRRPERVPETADFSLTADIKGSDHVPLMLDSCWPWGIAQSTAPPPEFDAVPSRGDPQEPWRGFCLDRHDGHVQALLLDWSVRKVGLKELWTLRWWQEFDTRGPWTKAGGVQPEDWPVWMRRFKDY